MSCLREVNVVDRVGQVCCCKRELIVQLVNAATGGTSPSCPPSCCAPVVA